MGLKKNGKHHKKGNKEVIGGMSRETFSDDIPLQQQEPTDPPSQSAPPQTESPEPNQGWDATCSDPGPTHPQPPPIQPPSPAGGYNTGPGYFQSYTWMPSYSPPNLPQASQGPPPPQAPSLATGIHSKPSQNYRQRRIDNVGILLVNRYQRIINETNSNLLVDTHTGNVLPETVDAISAPLAAQYRLTYNAEVSSGEIKRAFGHFVELELSLVERVFFGRAGYDPSCRQRYIDAYPGHCLIFDNGVMHWQSVAYQPRIQPTQSRSLSLQFNIYPDPSLINSLFDNTTLPRESDLLLIAWMILCWMPDRKQVMLELLGSPSASLEKAHSLIKNVVDPGTEDWLNELPGRVEKLNDLALKHYLLSFNQVDDMSAKLQQNLVSLMRGKQVAWQWKGKKVDASITVQCPVIINSLESVATEPRLVDATLSIEMEEDVGRYSMSGGVPSIESQVVAGLLSIFGYVNAHWGPVEYDKRFDQYGDLADLCRIGELVAGSLGRESAAFWQQLSANQRARREFELEESPVALAVKRMLDDEPAGVINIPVKEWLSRLAAHRPEGTSPELWPTSSRGLGAKFKQIQPLLREVGINLTPMGQRGPLRYWLAGKMQSSSSAEGQSGIL